MHGRLLLVCVQMGFLQAGYISKNTSLQMSWSDSHFTIPAHLNIEPGMIQSSAMSIKDRQQAIYALTKQRHVDCTCLLSSQKPMLIEAERESKTSTAMAAWTG